MLRPTEGGVTKACQKKLLRSLLSPMSSGGICRIPRIHLAGASAILVFHSMEFPTESDGIQWNQLESRSLQEWFPLECVGMCWNPLEFPYFGGIPTDSNRFQRIPMFAFVTIII